VLPNQQELSNRDVVVVVNRVDDEYDDVSFGQDLQSQQIFN